MNKFGLRFHHLGLAARDPKRARAFLEGLGYSIETAVYDPLQNVRLVMALHEDMPDVEIIWPGEGPGPLDQMFEKHRKDLVYHVCYSTDDVAAALDGLKQAGLAPFCVSESKPAVLFGGVPVSFHMLRGIGLIEIIEGAPRAPSPGAVLPGQP